MYTCVFGYQHADGSELFIDEIQQINNGGRLLASFALSNHIQLDYCSNSYLFSAVTNAIPSSNKVLYLCAVVS